MTIINSNYSPLAMVGGMLGMSDKPSIIIIIIIIHRWQCSLSWSLTEPGAVLLQPWLLCSTTKARRPHLQPCCYSHAATAMLLQPWSLRSPAMRT